MDSEQAMLKYNTLFITYLRHAEKPETPLLRGKAWDVYFKAQERVRRAWLHGRYGTFEQILEDAYTALDNAINS